MLLGNEGSLQGFICFAWRDHCPGIGKKIRRKKNRKCREEGTSGCSIPPKAAVCNQDSDLQLRLSTTSAIRDLCFGPFHGVCGILVGPPRDGTWALNSESLYSSPLDCQALSSNHPECNLQSHVSQLLV